ncbi:hypothetical protein RIR_jg35509.t1 [Rhizophagus irregularis DAOM 181602=DAOM 197198]|nr:hypothetical protein RIR_jg35509.t1 [Rhizophagus irregularis DAOM 181602=DAOM 197198]
MAKALYYGSFRAPRILLWSIGGKIPLPRYWRGSKISLATLVKTVKENTSFSRPSVMCIIATDWVTNGYL